MDLKKIPTLLKDGARAKVLKALSEAVGGPSFRELVELTGLPPTTLAYHLKVLTLKSLVVKGLKERPGRRDHSSYHLTEEGASYLRVLSSLKDVGARGMSEVAPPTLAKMISVTYMSVGPRCFSIPRTER